MVSASYITCLLAFTISWGVAKADETHGNLSFCKRATAHTDGNETVVNPRHNDCLGWTDDWEDIVLSEQDVGSTVQEDTAIGDFNWRYENGFLRPYNNNDLCLGSKLSILEANATAAYELILDECPSGSYEQNGSFEDIANERRMRFLLTGEGRIQSLAYVKEEATGIDVMEKVPFCVATMDDNRVYLTQCDKEDSMHEQLFDIQGTYSGSFLFSLDSIWGYEDVVKLAYQVGLSGIVEADGPVLFSIIDISIPFWSESSMSTMEIESYSLGVNPTGGVLSFSPSDQKVVGPMTATLRVLQTSKPDDHDFYDDNVSEVASHQVSFDISPSSPTINRIVGIGVNGQDNVRVGKGPNGNYVIFVLLLGAFLGCFLFSVFLERICYTRTRTVEESNDGKTVCIEDDEQDLYLEDEENGIEHQLPSERDDIPLEFSTNHPAREVVEESEEQISRTIPSS